jgi:hypothetical protein
MLKARKVNIGSGAGYVTAFCFNLLRYLLFGFMKCNCCVTSHSAGDDSNSFYASISCSTLYSRLLISAALWGKTSSLTLVNNKFSHVLVERVLKAPRILHEGRNRPWGLSFFPYLLLVDQKIMEHLCFSRWILFVKWNRLLLLLIIPNWLLLQFTYRWFPLFVTANRLAL